MVKTYNNISKRSNISNISTNKKLTSNYEEAEYDMVNEINDVWASESEEEAAVEAKPNRTGSSRNMQRSKSAASIVAKRPMSSFSSNSNYLKEYII